MVRIDATVKVGVMVKRSRRDEPAHDSRRRPPDRNESPYSGARSFTDSFRAAPSRQTVSVTESPGL